MAVSALAQLLDQQPTAYAEVLAACRAMGWNASPTAQPADIIDELPSNVLPLIRRMLALLIYGDGSADSPAVVPATDRLYAQMVSRVTSPNYPAAGFPSDPSDPFLPMSPTRRDFAHLEQALSALADRKISGADVPDGISLVHQLGNSDAANAITEIDDDNHGWVLDKAIGNIAPNCEKATLRFNRITAANALNSFHARKLHMPEVEVIKSGTSQYNDPMPANPEEIYMDELVESDCIFCQKDVRAKKISARKLRKLNGRCFYDWNVANEPLVELRLPELRNIPEGFLLCWTGDTSRKPWTNLILFEIGSDVSLNISAWNPTNALSSSASDLVADPTAHPTWTNLEQFLQNFRSHIALRLTDNGSGLTLTLSQAVFDTIWNQDGTPKSTDPDSVIYQINKIIKTDKHWSVNRA